MPLLFIFNVKFSQFCDGCFDPNWANISQIKAWFGREWYTRGRSCIAWDTGMFGYVTFIARNRHTDVNKFYANFSQFCVASFDPNWTDISIIPAHADGELYARGQSIIIFDISILCDVTFIASNRHAGAYIFNAIFSKFCDSYIDDNRTDISIIPAKSGREWYARGR